MPPYQVLGKPGVGSEPRKSRLLRIAVKLDEALRLFTPTVPVFFWGFIEFLSGVVAKAVYGQV